MRPLKILHLTTDSTRIAGAERILLGLGERLDRSRWSQVFATIRSPGPFNEQLKRQGHRTYALGANRPMETPLLLARLASLLRKERPDLLHTHLFHASVVGAAVCQLLPVRQVQTRHYSDYIDRFASRTAQLLDHWAARRCRGIAAVSDAAQRQLVEVEGVDPAQVVVVQNGVDWDQLSQLDPAPGRALLNTLGVPPGPQIGCAATFDQRKGHGHLIAAFSDVVRRIAGAQLILLGLGNEQSRLERQVARLGLSKQVHFLGHRDDAPSIMAALDLYVQPSVEEGFGLAVTEAMAMRRPVVVTEVGGMRYTVEHERTGLHVPPAAPRPLADAIVRLLENPAWGADLGRAASERVRDHFSLRRMIADYDQWYRRVLSG